ncbi:hypothetical protein EV424DRAFT_1349769 [Suillus variegatus]|nr:hypothetical protein EV424DRAFT_1349769 [Suillus variegatus]
MSHNPSGKRNHTAGIVLELQLKAWHCHLSIRIVPDGGENVEAFSHGQMVSMIGGFPIGNDGEGVKHGCPVLQGLWHLWQILAYCFMSEYCSGCMTLSATDTMAAGLAMALRIFLQEGPFNDADTSGSDTFFGIVLGPGTRNSENFGGRKWVSHKATQASHPGFHILQDNLCTIKGHVKRSPAAPGTQ